MHLAELASAAPDQIAKVFSTVGVSDLWKKVDAARKVPKGTSAEHMHVLTERRNRIAHNGDRSGRGRARITPDEVAEFYMHARTIVEAIDGVTGH